MNKNTFKEIYEMFGGNNEEIFNRLCEEHKIENADYNFNLSNPPQVHSEIEETLLKELQNLTTLYYLEYDNIFQ